MYILILLYFKYYLFISYEIAAFNNICVVDYILFIYYYYYYIIKFQNLFIEKNHFSIKLQNLDVP